MWPLTPFKKKKEVDFSHFDYSKSFYTDLFGLIKIEVISQDWYKKLSKSQQEKILLRIQLSKVRVRADLFRHNKNTISSIKKINDLICLLGGDDWISTSNEELIPNYGILFNSLIEIRRIIRSEYDPNERDERIFNIAKTLYINYAYLVKENIRLYREVVS